MYSSLVPRPSCHTVDPLPPKRVDSARGRPGNEARCGTGDKSWDTQESVGRDGHMGQADLSTLTLLE